MRRWLRWIVVAPVALAAMALAVANRERVTVSFDPLPLEFALPLYAVALGSLAIGIVLGGLGAWWAGRGGRRQARRDRRELRALNAELAALKSGAQSTDTTLPARANHLS